jgi:hypothetical protein
VQVTVASCSPVNHWMMILDGRQIAEARIERQRDEFPSLWRVTGIRQLPFNN